MIFKGLLCSLGCAFIYPYVCELVCTPDSLLFLQTHCFAYCRFRLDLIYIPTYSKYKSVQCILMRNKSNYCLLLCAFFSEWIAVCLCEWSAPIIFYFVYILSTKENVKKLLRKKVIRKRLEIGSKQSKSMFKKFFVLLIVPTAYQIPNIYDLFKKYCSF